MMFKSFGFQLKCSSSFRFGFLILSVAFLTGSCASHPVQEAEEPLPQVTFPKAASVAGAAYNLIQKEGLTLIELSTRDANGRELVGVTVAPEAGSNIVSIRYRGTEVLEQPTSLKDVYKQDAGIEFLYPTPNRVRNAELKYKDLHLKFQPNLGEHFIHGLAREFAWRWREPFFVGNTVIYKTWLNVTEGSEFHKKFPIKNRIELTLILEGEQLLFDFKVDNLDSKPLPFGVGVHPYFKLNGTRAQSSVQLKVSSLMDAVDQLPSGKIIPLKETKFAKLPTGMKVQDVLGADDVFWPTLPGGNALVKEPDFQFEIASSKDFGHTVLWVPPTRELFAVENQTASTDAHNLANQGMVKESGLIELGPEAKWTGWVSYRFSKKR